MLSRLSELVARIVIFACLFAGLASAQTKTYPLSSLESIQLRNVAAEPVTYNGRKALRVTEPAGRSRQEEDRLAILTGADFQNGVIEVDVAGKPGAGAPGAARGFLGIAFRIAPDVSKFECFYLRPTNGRADDQVRRNHTPQYISFPDFPWMRLRKEEPEKYESYADLVPGEWTKVKIEVQGVQARLHVHSAAQPALLVNDLKKGESRGAVGLWIGPGTEGHFTNLRITR